MRQFETGSGVTQVFEALLGGLMAEAAKRGEGRPVTGQYRLPTARAHHDAAGMRIGEEVITALEKGAAEEAKARSKGTGGPGMAAEREVLGGRPAPAVLRRLDDGTRYHRGHRGSRQSDGGPGNALRRP
ncbi:hypothetical protein [Streptomyces sp. NPDC001508]|uniref:hypothetical protein n=1 Tax=Streptomyces sp. NPDC001508 TaxID=3154656 RepID=UPI00331E988F